jgi:aspartate/methionine/tyrosine aminotransferase
MAGIIETTRKPLVLSQRTAGFQESVIREMTRIGAEVGGVDIAQGLPNFDPPEEVVAALAKAIQNPEHHQYSFTWGSREFRTAIADKYARFNGWRPDPDTEVTVTCGVSEALISVVMSLTEPGDEVIVFEPWYENYLPGCILAGVTPKFVPLDEPDYALNPERLRAAITPRTRLIIITTPGNPTGHVFTRDELQDIGAICQEHGIIAVTDEIYEHIWYHDHKHISLATIPGMEDRTVTLSGLGKSYAVTGWRIGWAVAAPPLTALIRKVHDYLTVCAPAPFQEAGRTALAMPDEYYVDMRAKYAKRREILVGALSDAGFGFAEPQGAYYIMIDAAPLGWKNDWDFVNFLAREVGIIAVPGSSFYEDGGYTKARVNFAKTEATLEEAARRLRTHDLRAK